MDSCEALRGVNLAQPIRLGPDPCELGPKNPTLKKIPHQRSSQCQKPHKSLVDQANSWALIIKMKNILFFKICY